MQIYTPCGNDVGRLLYLTGKHDIDVGPYRLIFYLQNGNLAITIPSLFKTIVGKYYYFDVYNLSEAIPSAMPDFWTDITDLDRAKILYTHAVPDFWNGSADFEQAGGDLLYYFLYSIWRRLLSDEDNNTVDQILAESSLEL